MLLYIKISVLPLLRVENAENVLEGFARKVMAKVSERNLMTRPHFFLRSRARTEEETHFSDVCRDRREMANEWPVTFQVRYHLKMQCNNYNQRDPVFGSMKRLMGNGKRMAGSTSGRVLISSNNYNLL